MSHFPTTPWRGRYTVDGAASTTIVIVDDRTSGRLLERLGASKVPRLCFAGRVPIESGNRLLVNAEITRATGYIEWLTAVAIVDALDRPWEQSTVAGTDRRLKRAAACWTRTTAV